MHTRRSALIIIATAFEYLVDGTAVKGCNILYICHILQAPFNLETSYSGIHHGFEVCRTVHVAQGEQMASLLRSWTRIFVFRSIDDPTVGIYEVEGKTTELGTATTVGGT